MKLLPAIGISLAIHAALGLGVAAYVEWGVDTETLATLDLSSVELSFAEDESPDSAPAAVASDPLPPPPVPESVEPPPAPEAEPLPDLPPEAEALKLPEPEERREQMSEARTEPPRDEAEVPPPPREEPAVQSAASAPRQAKVDAPPRPRASIRPDYPRLARLRGAEGSVLVEIRVNARGTVDEVTVVSSSGHDDLDAAAVKAAKAARFEPAKSGGKSVPSTARLTLDFKLK